MSNEKTTPRKIDDIIDLPYSELTDEEIESIIDFKAACKSRDEMHSERMRLIQENLAEITRINKEIADKAQKQLENLTQHAINRFEEVSNEQEK